MASSTTPRQLLTTHCRQCLHRALSNRPSTPITTRPFQPQRSLSRPLHTTTPRAYAPPSHPPKTRDRGPASKEDTQTDFSAMNILASTPPPTTGVDACTDDGFALNSELKITSAGALLLNGEAFRWRPWARASDAPPDSESMSGTLRNARGQFDVPGHVWGALELCWPKPDLLILGTGKGILPLAPETRRRLTELGVRVEVQDTRNAAAQFNLLATERGVGVVGAALVPMGWREGR